jgi:N-hydroxyarylamine O-acetyltransferase
VFDLDAYLHRIGLGGRPSFAAIHRAHSTSIPFENLDPRAGRAVSLAPEDLQRKMLTERRGGYCFEQNLLLAAAMEAMGHPVELFLARVRYGARPGVLRPRSHLVLRVQSDGGSWLCDVGFGPGTLFDPLPWVPGPAHEQSGWRYRIRQDGPELVVQVGEGEGWVDLYGFPPAPVPLIDVETINWWVCTHPASPFVTGLVVSIQDDDGRRIALSDSGGLALSERSPAETTTTAVQLTDLPRLLATRFGLEGIGADGPGLLEPLQPRRG